MTEENLTGDLAEEVDGVTASTLIGGNSRTGHMAPFVRLTVHLADGSIRESDIEPAKALAIGASLIEAAVIARQDVAAFRHLTADMGIDREAAASFLAHVGYLREHLDCPPTDPTVN